MDTKLIEQIYQNGIPIIRKDEPTSDLQEPQFQASISTSATDRFLSGLKSAPNANLFREMPICGGILPEKELLFFEEVVKNHPQIYDLKHPYGSDPRFEGFKIAIDSKFLSLPSVIPQRLEIGHTEGSMKDSILFQRLAEGTFSLNLLYRGCPEGFLSFYLARTKAGKDALVCAQIQGYNRIIKSELLNIELTPEEDYTEVNSTPPGIQKLSKIQDNGTPISWRKLLLEEFIKFAHDHSMSAYLVSAQRNRSVHPDSYPLETAVNHYNKIASQCGMRELKSGFFVARA